MLKSPLRLCDIEYNKTVLRLLFDFLLECEPYKYGTDCATQCGHCKGGGSCSMDTGNCPGGCTYGWIGERCDICRLYTSRNKNMFTVSYASQSYLSHIKVTFQLPFSHVSLDWIKKMHPVFNVTFQNNFGNFNIQVGFLWEKNTLILSFPPIFQSKHCIIFYNCVVYKWIVRLFYFKFAVMVLTSRVKVV